MSIRKRSAIRKSKSSDATNPNKQALRAIVITGEDIVKQVSNNLGESEDISMDPTAALNIVEPPLPMEVLSLLPENSSELIQVIEAMEINIEGFGQRVITRRKMSDEQKEKYKTELSRERMELESLTEIINADESMTSLRRKTRKELESTGNAYWELLTGANDPNKLLGATLALSKTIKITKQDKTPVQVTKKWLNENFEWEEKLFYKKFRRFIQRQGSKIVYFKEWDDPRIIDKRDGKVAEPGLDKKYHATPMVHFSIFTGARAPYGVPRLIGNLFSLWGSRSADQINFTTFKNNNIPSMVITVSNGQLTEGSIQRVEEFISSQVRRSDNRSAFLILEGEPADEDSTTNPGAMKIDIKPMTDNQHSDQLFQNYDKNNADKIRRAFRLPPIFVGKAEDFNKATAEASRRLADEQVFGPERDEIDRKINNILTQYGFKFYKIKSNSPNVTDDEIIAKMLMGLEKTGALTPNIGREIISDIFNREIPQIEASDKFDPNIPFSLTMAEAVKKLDGSPPNQGQVTGAESSLTDKRKSPVDILKELDKFFEDDAGEIDDPGIFGVRK